MPGTDVDPGKRYVPLGGGGGGGGGGEDMGGQRINSDQDLLRSDVQGVTGRAFVSVLFQSHVTCFCAGKSCM